MNKKLFTALLLGATVLSTSTFVSCKDYNDEIDDLQTQIDKANSLHATKEELKAEIASLKTTLEGDVAALNNEIQLLDQAYKAADKTEATERENADKAQQAEIEALTGRVETLEAKVAADEAKIAALEEADIRLENLINTKVDATVFEDSVAIIYAKIESCSKTCAANLAEAVGKLETKDAELDAAIKKAAADLEAADKILQSNIDKVDAKAEANTVLITTLQENYKTQQKAIENFETRISAIEKDYLKQEDYDKLNDKIASVKTTIENEIADLQKLVNTKADQTTVDALATRVATAEKAIQDINVELETLNALVTTSLRSLVFVPDSYYWGVEATEINYLIYQAYTCPAADVTKEDVEATMGGTEVRGHEHNGKVVDGTKVLSFAATYHMNPASADLTGASYALLSADKDYVRTATEADALLSIVGTPTTANGDLTVELDAQKPELIKEVPTNQAITVFAVQVTLPEAQQSKKGDATVTSDYATLYRSDIRGLVMGYNKSYQIQEDVKNDHCGPCTYYKYNEGQKTYTGDHLFATEAELIDACKTAGHGQYYVDYNTTIDLANLVETHYTDENGTHMFMTADKLAAVGLEYKYELVGHIVNDVNESAYAALNGSVLCPQGVDKDGKQQAYDETKHAIESIGKCPVVRVSLVDAENGTVYDYGYIMIQITDKSANPELTYPTDLTYNSDCHPGDYVYSVTTDQLFKDLAAQCSITKEYFDNEYDTKNADFKQYVMNADGTAYVELAADKYVGAVTYDATKKALVWTVKSNDIRDMFYNKRKSFDTVTEHMQVVVKLASRYNTSRDVYVKISTTVTIKESYAIAWEDADKISNYWYTHNGNSADAAGFEEIHAQTLSPEDPQSADPGYAKVLDDTFSDVFANNYIWLNKVYDITKNGEFADDSLALDLQFSEWNNDKVYSAADYSDATKGTLKCTYTLKVTDNGKTLVAYKKNGVDMDKAQTVATIEGTGVNSQKVVYQHSTASEGLLNYAAHNKLADDVILAKIKLVAQNTGSCAHNLPLLKNTFDVRFLRPINVFTKDLELTDAKDSKQQIAIKDLISDITDWREYSFATHPSYWNYYNIKSIKVLGATSGNSINGTVTTNMNGSDITNTKLSDVSDQVLFTGVYKSYSATGTKVDPTTLDYGYILYQNLSSTVRTFTVRIPLAVEYEWGTVVTYADVKINSTVGAKKR